MGRIIILARNPGAREVERQWVGGGEKAQPILCSRHYIALHLETSNCQVTYFPGSSFSIGGLCLFCI